MKMDVGIPASHTLMSIRDMVAKSFERSVPQAAAKRVLVSCKVLFSMQGALSQPERRSLR